jgi:CRP-like cAMP-binding protein
MRATQPLSLFEQQVDGAIRSSIFRLLPPAPLDRLRTDAIRVELPSGRFLPDAGLILMVGGLVRVFAAGPDGRQVTVAYLRAGDVMGLARTAGRRYPVAFQTVLDCRVLRIDPQRFEDLRGRHADLAWAAAGQLARHLDDVVNAMMLSALGSVRQRVIYHLLALSTPTSGDGCRACRVTRQQLADSVGSVREVVTRVLSELRREGLITGQDRLLIQDPERLRGEVDDLLGRRTNAWAELGSRSA